MMEHKITKWRTVESEYLIQRPWLTARRDKVELPDGRVHPEYYVLEYPDWVNVIAIIEDGQFVMVKQYRQRLEDVFADPLVYYLQDRTKHPRRCQRKTSGSHI